MNKLVNKIYCGDNIELIKSIPDNYIDLTITSPPYDDLRKYNGYVFNFEKLVKELFRVTKKNGVVVWIVNDKTKNGSETGTSFRQALFFQEIGFNINDTMIWEKTNPLPTDTRYRYYQCFEYMFIFSKGKPKTVNLIKEKNENKKRSYKSSWGRDCNDKMITSTGKKRQVKNEKIKRNIFKYPIGLNVSTKDKIAFEHPAIFPEKLARDHILTWSNEEDIVFDPMCGSGTSLKMAIALKRKFIGFDISQKYVDLSNKRINDFLIQNKLFQGD